MNKSKSNGTGKSSARPANEQKHSVKNSGSIDSTIPATAYNPLSGTFHSVDASNNATVFSKSPFGTLTEHDSLSNNSGDSSENPKDKTTAKRVLASADGDRREKIRLHNEKKHQRQRERKAKELHDTCSSYLMSRKVEAFTQQLVAMGFPYERANMALLLNEGKMEDSVSWLFDLGENNGDVDIQQLGLSVDDMKIDITDELARISEIGAKCKCAIEEVKRVVIVYEGDLEKAEETLRAEAEETFRTQKQKIQTTEIKNLKKPEQKPVAHLIRKPQKSTVETKRAPLLVSSAVPRAPPAEQRWEPIVKSSLVVPPAAAPPQVAVAPPPRGPAPVNVPAVAPPQVAAPPPRGPAPVNVPIENAIRSEGKNVQHGPVMEPIFQHSRPLPAKQNVVSGKSVLPAVENVGPGGKLLLPNQSSEQFRIQTPGPSFFAFNHIGSSSTPNSSPALVNVPVRPGIIENSIGPEGKNVQQGVVIEPIFQHSRPLLAKQSLGSGKSILPAVENAGPGGKLLPGQSSEQFQNRTPGPTLFAYNHTGSSSSITNSSPAVKNAGPGGKLLPGQSSEQFGNRTHGPSLFAYNPIDSFSATNSSPAVENARPGGKLLPNQSSEQFRIQNPGSSLFAYNQIGSSSATNSSLAVENAGPGAKLLPSQSLEQFRNRTHGPSLFAYDPTDFSSTRNSSPAVENAGPGGKLLPSQGSEQFRIQTPGPSLFAYNQIGSSSTTNPSPAVKNAGPDGKLLPNQSYEQFRNQTPGPTFFAYNQIGSSLTTNPLPAVKNAGPGGKLLPNQSYEQFRRPTFFADNHIGSSSTKNSSPAVKIAGPGGKLLPNQSYEQFRNRTPAPSLFAHKNIGSSANKNFSPARQAFPKASTTPPVPFYSEPNQHSSNGFDLSELGGSLPELAPGQPSICQYVGGGLHPGPTKIEEFKNGILTYDFTTIDWTVYPDLATQFAATMARLHPKRDPKPKPQQDPKLQPQQSSVKPKSTGVFMPIPRSNSSAEVSSVPGNSGISRTMENLYRSYTPFEFNNGGGTSQQPTSAGMLNNGGVTWQQPTSTAGMSSGWTF